jgi:kumamolisin
MDRVILKGSKRTRLAQARVRGNADPGERLEVSIVVRRRAADALRARVNAITLGAGPAQFMNRTEFAERHGADPADFQAVRDFAAGHGLSVVQAQAARRTMILSGTVAQFESAFGVKLKRFDHPGGSYRGRTGSIELPAHLEGIIEAVLGLDNRPQARPHFRLATAVARGARRTRRAGSAPSSYTPLQIAALYGFPPATGQGQCVAIIELGGGYRPDDLSQYFSNLKTGTPSVIAVSVDHAQNAPTGNANGPDGEVMLDIEVAGAIAPAAHIAVYFAPNTDAGFLDAITTAIHDTTNQPSVISISWGSAESTWTSQAMTAMDEAFQAAAALGITVCVASGDNGSTDGVAAGGDHVDFPASSPFALGCGGTRLQAAGSGKPSEVVWNDGASGGASGGGSSAFFALPSWQTGLSVKPRTGRPTPLKSRGVPDVSGDADPQSGYQVRVDGTDTVIGGTSAVAPLWAGLIARLNQLAGKSSGYLNPMLYQNTGSLRDITQGNNGGYAAAPGWDACTGLGSPNGSALASLTPRRRRGVPRRSR